ncbi:hypothetical protein [Pantanalinema sp. GBBB05]|uniref:hypothetical protein n=1 Tax=Pantanalinema sp. GBBB05 TaxID=2604139 RepID=UPI001DC6A4AB|nr:hypothetical protein [Pantanalinema sp. GBBB05]
MTLSDADLKYEVVIRQVLEELEKLEIQRIFQRIYKDYGGAGYLDYLLRNALFMITTMIDLTENGTMALLSTNIPANQPFVKQGEMPGKYL